MTVRVIRSGLRSRSWSDPSGVSYTGMVEGLLGWVTRSRHVRAWDFDGDGSSWACR